MSDKPRLHTRDAIPATLHPYPSLTLLDVVRSAAHERPRHPALLFQRTTLSYQELDQTSDVLAAALVALGVTKGDRVALILPNCPQAVIGQLGAWKAGAIAAPLNPYYTDQELKAALNECGAKVALVLAPFYAKVKAIQAGTPLRHLITTRIGEYLPLRDRLRFVLLAERNHGPAAIQVGDERLADLLRRYRGRPCPAVSVYPDDPALLLFTGGTTGTPKVAVGTHQALMMAGMQIAAWLQGALVPWDDVILLNMPLFHVYGNVGVMATGLIGHHPLALVPNPRDVDAMLRIIHRTRPAFVPGVPSLFHALMDHPAVQSGKADLRSVKFFMCGAAPLLTESRNRFEKLTNRRIIEGYALTESMMAAVVTPIRGLDKIGSTGLPLPDVEIRIVDERAETPLPPGEIGEILMRAPQLMHAYWQRPAETEMVIRDGWLHTGDLGYLDDDGYLFIVDRQKNLIKPGEYQVWPHEVEAVIASHPAVADVGVAGVEDDTLGEAVKAWVVFREGQQATADELRRYCRERLAAYKIPRHFEFCSSLPRSTIGKVLWRLLVEGHPAAGQLRG